MEETYKGYQIKYDQTTEKFDVKIGDSNYQNSNLPSIRKYIDRLDKKDFKKVDVIVDDRAEMSNAIVTSYPDNQEQSYYKECWVSFKEKTLYHSRNKISITQVFLDNPHNREILAQMKERESAIEMLKTEIRRLKDTLETYKPDD